MPGEAETIIAELLGEDFGRMAAPVTAALTEAGLLLTGDAQEMLDLCRVAALRIRAGKRNWADAEVMADLVAGLTARRPVSGSVTVVPPEPAPPALAALAGKWEAEAGRAELPPAAAHLLRMCAAQLRVARADTVPDLIPAALMCALPDDCVNGPAPHPFVPPADADTLCCTRQPWEDNPPPVPVEDTHLARMLAVVTSKHPDVTVSLEEYRGAGPLRLVRTPGLLRFDAGNGKP